MKRCSMLAAVLCILSLPLFSETRDREEGTIVRMRMADCITPQHSFMSAMSGVQAAPGEQCTEYVLVADKVVYVIVGRSSDQLIPLAETTRFHMQKNEVLIRIDDERRESRFHVKAMMLRPEYDRSQQIEEAEALAAMATHRHLDAATLVNAR